MRRSTVTGLVVVLIGVSGCASLLPPIEAPLTLAFTAPVAHLEARAARGENEAEYALSFLILHRLRGVRPDQVHFQRLRAGAQTPTTLMITQYTAAIGGGTGRVNVIPVTQPGLSERVMALLDLCGAALLGGSDKAATSFCPTDSIERLAPLARQAAAESAASTPLP